MIIDLTALLTGEASTIDIEFDFTPDMGEEAPMALADVSFPHGAHAKGRAVDNAGYIRLELEVSAPWQGECARCLEQVNGTLEFFFERTVAAKGTLENEEEAASKVLCDPDCPGMCARCGKSLKNGDCGCNKKEHDPRWDVLRTMKFPDDPADQ